MIHDKPVTKLQKNQIDWRLVIGFAILVVGISLFTAQATHMPLIALISPVMAGLILLVAFIRDGQTGYLIGGSLLAAGGLGNLWLNQAILQGNWLRGLGGAALMLALGFAFLVPAIWLRNKWIIEWPLIPSVILFGFAAVLLGTSASVFDFVLVVGTAIGLVYLAAGWRTRLLGLIIAGGVVTGLAAGLAFSWGFMSAARPLAQTGAMLIWFGVGWLLVTVVVRLSMHRLIWWPLIPGGILAVVGWGLYVSGNPKNAMSLLGNTGSLMMVALGLYLILIRRSIRK